MSKHILITNIVTLNPGDAAILQGMIHLLRAKYGKECSITVFDRNAVAARNYYEWADFRQCLFPPKWDSSLVNKVKNLGYGHWLSRLRYLQVRALLIILQGSFPFLARIIAGKDLIESVNLYLSADLIVSTGGTYLVENYDLNSCRYDFEISLLCRAKFGLFTQSIGHFKKKINIKNFSRIFKRSDFIFLRDEKSKQHVLSLGVQEEKIHLAADAAFVLRGQNGPIKEIPKVQDSTFRIAFSVRSMKNFHEDLEMQYYQSIAKTVEKLVIDHGAEISFLSTCQGIKEYWANDAETAYIIYTFLEPSVKEKVILDAEFRQPKNIIDIYSTFDLVVATRMHSAILAVCAGTPAIGIAYEFKITELFNNLGLKELSLTVEELSDTALEKKILEVIEHIKIYRKKICVKRDEMDASAGSVIMHLPDL